MSNDFSVPDIKHTTYIKASPERVFEHISTGEGWDAWFTKGTTVDLRVGGKIVLNWVNFGIDHYTLECECFITEIVQNSRLVFRWGTDCNTEVSLSLTPLDEGTVLEVVDSGYPLSEEGLSAFLSCATGWGQALTLLKFYLETGAVYKEVPESKEAA